MKRIQLKAAGSTNVGSLAGSISKNLEEGKDVEIIAIGAPAVNQTAKALATASGHAGSKAKSLDIGVGFTQTDVRTEVGLETKTAMLFSVRYRN